MFDLILSFLSNRRLQLALDQKSLQELDQKSFQGYPVNDGVPQGTILGHAFFVLHINDLIILSVILILLPTPSVIWHLNLTYKTLYSRLGSGLLISKLEKLRLFRLTGLKFLIRQNHILRWWDCLAVLN